MTRIILTSLWSRRRRLLGASIAVVIGVAFLVATLVLGDSMRAGFDSAFSQMYAGTDLVVRSSTEIGADGVTQRGTLDATVAQEINAVPGVERIAISVEGTAQIVGADGTPIGGEGPPTLGGNWIDEPDRTTGGFNPYTLVEGGPPLADEEVVIDRGSATSGDLHIGDRTTILTPDPVPVTIVGIASFGGDDSIGGSSYAGFTLATSQHLFVDDPDRITSVQIAVNDSSSPTVVRSTLQTTLPAGIQVVDRAELVAEQNQMVEDEFIGFFEALLLVFAMVALLVATFSIHNTFSILVAQRTAESALLRALGASRRQVLMSVTIESFIVGLVASAVGLGAGIGLAAGLKELMDVAGFGLPGALGLTVVTETLVVASLIGIGVTLLASVAPAVRASKVAPLASMREAAVDRSSASKRRAIIGATLGAAGGAIVVSASTAGDSALVRAGVGSVVTLVGLILLGPVVARVATSLIGLPVAAIRGPAGKMARRNAMRQPKRTAGTASALMLGTAVVVFFASFGSSVKATFDGILDQSFSNDLVIARTSSTGAPLSADLVTQIAALDQVAVAAALADAPIRLDGAEVLAMAGEPAAVAAVADLQVVKGSMAAVGSLGLAVSDDFAEDRGWVVGRQVPIAFADGGTATLTLNAVYGSRNVLGDIFIPTALWRSHHGRGGDAVVLVTLAEGVNIPDGQAAVQVVADRVGAPDVQNRAQFLADKTADIDESLGLIYGLLGLAILIAVIGIANTLSLSLHERTRELGLLRAVGQSRSQLRSTVRWESVIISIFGTVGGVGLGTFLSWGVVRALSAQEDVGIFRLPVTTLVIVLALAVVAGIVAAIRPARRAARLDILAAIATV